jgi:antitoxin component YwqK of YwqJK toxin-antitoxin module
VKFLKLFVIILVIRSNVAPAQVKNQSPSAKDSSAADNLLEQVYGKLSPDIVRMLADSGSVNELRHRTGKWNEYSFRSCLNCGKQLINYDSLVKANELYEGNIYFVKETGLYFYNKRVGMWVTYETSRLSPPFDWNLYSKVEYINDHKQGWEEIFLGAYKAQLYVYSKINYQDGLPEGSFYQFDEKGDTTLIGNFTHGLENGLFKFRNDSIPIFNFDRVYNNGEEGETIFYHDNGVIASRGLLLDMTPHGLVKSYNENGQLVQEENFNMGVHDGESKEYYDDGKLKRMVMYANDNMTGISKLYHDNEQLWSETEMRDNKFWTAISSYDRNGKPQDKGTLKNGNGTLKTYNEKGELTAEADYEKGVLEGTSRGYENGRLKEVVSFKDNQVTGINKSYHDNGQLWREIEMKGGKVWQVLSNYDRNGRPQDKGTLKRGNGTLKRYDENGKLIAVDHYKDGEVVQQ